MIQCKSTYLLNHRIYNYSQTSNTIEARNDYDLEVLINNYYYSLGVHLTSWINKEEIGKDVLQTKDKSHSIFSLIDVLKYYKEDRNAWNLECINLKNVIEYYPNPVLPTKTTEEIIENIEPTLLYGDGNEILFGDGQTILII